MRAGRHLGRRGILGQGLPVGAIELGSGRQGTAVAIDHVAHVRIDGVGGDKGLGLGGDGGEDALLVEADAVGAATVRVGVKAGAANLERRD